MTVLKLSEAKAHLGHYANQAKNGMSFVLTDRNQPIASIVPFQNESSLGINPQFGLANCKVEISEDFNAPISSFENDFYGN